MRSVLTPPPAWPRRRRVAGFAKSGASGGCVPIPVTCRDRARYRQRFVERVRALPGIELTTVPGTPAHGLRVVLNEACASGPAEAFLRERDLAEIATNGDLLLRLPPDTRRSLAAAGWVIPHGGALRIPCARKDPEFEVIWRIFLCAYELATAAPDDKGRRGRGETAGVRLAPARPPAESGAVI